MLQRNTIYTGLLNIKHSLSLIDKNQPCFGKVKAEIQALSALSSSERKRNCPAFSDYMKRFVLSKVLNVAFEEIILDKTPFGCPFLVGLSDVHFNVSHSGSYWAIAIQKGEHLGLDIEQHRPRKNMRKIAETYFHPEEVALLKAIKQQEQTEMLFYKLWTSKESFAKYQQTGLNTPLLARNLTHEFNTPHSPILQNYHLISDKNEIDNKIHITLTFNRPCIVLDPFFINDLCEQQFFR